MNRQQALIIVRNMVQRLTPAQRRILRLLMEHEGEPLTRRHIAQLMGKRYLMRYDIQILDKLVEVGLVDIRKNRMSDIYGRPSNYRGQNIRMASQFYTYTLDSSIADYLRAITKKPKPMARQAQPRGQVVKSSPLGWLRDKLGI